MIAIDTNVFVYRFDRTERDKQEIAYDLISRLSYSGEALLLWQVAGELLNQLRHMQNKNQIEPAHVKRVMNGMRKLFPLVMPEPSVLDHAIALCERYSLQHWDSMLLGACLEANVTTLYTEDMGAPRKIETIELVNPF